MRRDELTRQWGQRAKERGLTGPAPGNKIGLPWQKDQVSWGGKIKSQPPQTHCPPRAIHGGLDLSHLSSMHHSSPGVCASWV